MKDTNAIETAIKQKCEKEIELIVASFINEVETKLRGEYNNASFYDIKDVSSHPNKRAFSLMGLQQLSIVLNNTLKSAHIESMLSVKSRELLKKIELI